MKQQYLISRADLPNELARLENFLLEKTATDQLWPLDGLDGDAVENFISAVYRLYWECLAMQLRENMPNLPLYRYQGFISSDFPSMIQLTRQLVLCCDECLIDQYRCVTPSELETITLLAELHHALIGHYYFQHPGLETVSAHEVRFRH